MPTAFFLQLFDSGTIKIHNGVTDATRDETVRTLMDTASPASLKEANRKFNIVQAYFQRHTDIYKDINPRTLRRWVQQFREAEASYGCGYVGLLSRTHQQGNRQPKSPTDSSELLDKFIREHFETPRQATGASVYRAYVRACTALNIQPLSNRTFYQRLKKRPTHEQTLKRKGAKAAYATEPFVWELALNAPQSEDSALNDSSYRNGYAPQLPLLLIEKRSFNFKTITRTYPNASAVRTHGNRSN